MGTDHTEFFEAGSSSRLQLRLVMCPSTRAQMCSQICTPVAFSCRRRRNSAAELGPLARYKTASQDCVARQHRIKEHHLQARAGVGEHRRPGAALVVVRRAEVARHVVLHAAGRVVWEVAPPLRAGTWGGLNRGCASLQSKCEESLVPALVRAVCEKVCEQWRSLGETK